MRERGRNTRKKPAPYWLPAVPRHARMPAGQPVRFASNIARSQRMIGSDRFTFLRCFSRCQSGDTCPRSSTRAFHLRHASCPRNRRNGRKGVWLRAAPEKHLSESTSYRARGQERTSEVCEDCWEKCAVLMDTRARWLCAIEDCRAKAQVRQIRTVGSKRFYRAKNKR